MSEEHLWSEWMAPLMPRGRQFRHIEYAERFHGRSTIGKMHRTRPGSAIVKQFKVVCTRCNTSWMSAMEDAAKPRLIPLIKGEATLLNDRDRQMVADWIMLKVLIADHSSYQNIPSDALYSKQDYEYFRILREIPFGVRIWIAQHTGRRWKSAIYWHAVGISPPGSPIPEGTLAPKNTHAFALGIGALLVHVLMTTSEPVYSWLRMENLVPPFRRLWPLTPEDIRWPPLFTMTDADADGLVESFNEFVSGPHVQFVGHVNKGG